MNKLKSRKFWVAVVSGVLVVITEGLGIKVPSETILAFAAIVIGYLVAEGAADAAGAFKK